jgi:fatty acid amide hydrolase
MARSVADLTLALRVLTAPGQDRVDPPIAPVAWREPGAVDLASLRIAYYEDDGFFPAAASVRRAVREAVDMLRGCGARVEAFVPPDVAGAMRLFLGILSADGAAGAKRRLGAHRRDPRIAGLLQIAGLSPALRPLAVSFAGLLGQRRLAQQIASIRPIDADEYWSLVEAQAAYRRDFVAELDRRGFDAIVCPPHALPALTHGSAYYLTTAASYAMLYNLLGMPAGVVPVTRVRDDEQNPPRAGRDIVERTARDVVRGSAGLPLGVQVVARHWREDVALAVMGAIEAQQPD